MTPDVAALPARWWSRPTEDERAAWTAAWPRAREAAAALGLAADGVDELRLTLSAADGETLLEEYERLFVGPGRAPVPPYESLWRADGPRREHGRLMGAPAADAVRLYRALGLSLRRDAHELPDHVAVEWEALAYALARDAREQAAALVQAHLALWMPAFCAAVAAAAEQPFYRALALLTAAWTEALAR
ncbi:MAG TPA: molecular chaperone TorD family protein [Gaiellaceae bacterium]|nr:molecular chaperone TorD family protein [Gaiellaceae bacterium]